MVKDSIFDNLHESSGDFTFINEAPTPNPEQSPYVGYGLETGDLTLSMDLPNDVFPLSPEIGTLVQSFNDETAEIECVDHGTDTIYEFFNQILMEENMDEMPSMFHDPLALQATEKSFYDVIDKKYPPSDSIESPADFDTSTECCKISFESTCETNGNSVDPSWAGDPGCYDFPAGQFHSLKGSIQSSFTSSQSLLDSVNSSGNYTGGQINPFVNLNLISSLLSDNEPMFQFLKGVGEARKLLPTNSKLVVDLDKNTLTSDREKEPSKGQITVEKDQSPTTSGRKHLHRQDSDLDTRSRKQSAIYEDEVELSEVFDKVLLRDVEGVRVSSKGDIKFLNGIDKYLEQNSISQVSRNDKPPNKRKGKESDAVDLQSLLIRCAQAAASDDLRTAREQLKQIRKYASTTGDASQRVANVFADGLEARLAGTGTQMYAALASKRISTAKIIKAYQVYLSACPFRDISMIFANMMILKVAAKASTLHIVDFGISYGLQWPVLIQFLSIRHGGPPKLRITGIDLPRAGFRPAELIEETGQRLAKYCKRFNVPFEYQAIARKSWETIGIADLKLARDEVLVANCLLRFQNLPEEKVVVENPKDGVLKLIRRMKPNLFVHSVENGSHNAPIFMTRFREAFFYYASLFDMLDVTLPRNDLQRLQFENEFYGREVVNIIACEGQQRVVRPETYKQWQIRSRRAGFEILPLDKATILRAKLKAGYHKDFLFDEDCNWMLQGWKGRVLYASSCWVPV